MKNHVVAEGETLAGIAGENGFHWETLWNHPDNKGLKEKRQEPGWVAAGDVVVIPEIREKSESCVTDRLHVFRKRIDVPPPVPERTWIEIQLWDQTTSKPVPGASYRLTLGDGSVREGRLDDSGLARYDGVDPRKAQVEFPKWDAADWEPGLPKDQEDERAWIEIALVDEEGNPVPYQPYKLLLPDGSVRHGWIGAEGVARRNDVIPGRCEVLFPRLDAEDWRRGQPPGGSDA